MSSVTLELTEAFHCGTKPSCKVSWVSNADTENPSDLVMGYHSLPWLLWGVTLRFPSPIPPSLPRSPHLSTPTPFHSNLPNLLFCSPSFLLFFKDLPCNEAETSCHTPILGGGGDNDTVFSNSPTTDGVWRNMGLMHACFSTY